MPRRNLIRNVMKEAYERVLKLYKSQHRIVCSFSAGKDSGIALELCIMAAGETGRLPVDVMMRDEEIMVPGTFEYAHRVYKRPEVNFRWFIQYQPVNNIFNRREPYFWVFDKLIPPNKWVRQPPKFAIIRTGNHINKLVNAKYFPVDTEAGEKIINVMGLRASESRNRFLGMMSAKSYITGGVKREVWGCWPIYDWKTGDVWKAMKEMEWDYNTAYDGFCRMKLPASVQRVAPPTLIYASVRQLQAAQKLWPRWFDIICERLPGVRSGVQFGYWAVTPHRRLGENWKQCYYRECLGKDSDTPKWIIDRSQVFMDTILRKHKRHSSAPLPQDGRCPLCHTGNASWLELTMTMYAGDPFCLGQQIVGYMEPEFFRPGAGVWGGSPAFK